MGEPTTALKFLNPDGTGRHSGYEWPLPNGKPGKWVSVKGKLVPCKNGIHACTPGQALGWLNDRAFLIELGGKVIDTDNKLCARKGRLVRELDWNPRLFAADCAEHVLPIFEEKRPNDKRPRKAIEAVRAYTRGEIDAAQLRAARGAAGGAAWAAWAARDAAWAARDAAGAARDAAGAAAERTWQANHLLTCLNLTDEEREILSPRNGGK